MPIDIPVAGIEPSWLSDVYFPPLHPAVTTVGTVGPSATGQLQWGTDLSNTSNFLALKAGHVGGSYGIVQGLPTFQLVPTATFQSGHHWCDEMLMSLILSSSSADRLEFAGASERYRIYWDQFYMATGLLADVRSSSVGYVPVNAAIDADVTEASANARWGIRADGSGGFEFFAYNGAGLTIQSALTWPASANDEWVKVDILHFDATSGADAFLQIFLNNGIVQTRSWGPGTLLPTWSQSVSANPIHIRRFWVAANIATLNAWFFTRVRCRAGIFNNTDVKALG